jgi:hypothetical protein
VPWVPAAHGTFVLAASTKAVRGAGGGGY